MDDRRTIESRQSGSKARRGLPKRHWTTNIGQAAGHPAAFVVVVLYAAAWIAFDRSTFDWNAVATLAVFVMTLFIQRANRRDNLALHAKLDELLRVDHAARSELTQLDEQEPEAIEDHRDEEVRKSGEGERAVQLSLARKKQCADKN
jgi:low affinity Fe/Cu permease